MNTRLVNIAEKALYGRALQDLGYILNFERALKCTPHHGQNSLLDFHSSICPFVRNNLLQVRCRTTHPTHHQGVCKDRAGHSYKTPLSPSARAFFQFPLWINFSGQKNKTSKKPNQTTTRDLQEARSSHFCECGRWSLRVHHSSSSCFTCSVSLPLLHPFLNCTTDGSSWFLKGFYFLISIFHVSFEFGTIPFSSEEETLC